MALLYDMVKMTVTGAPGTGTITLAAASPGFQTFATAGVADQQVVSYSAVDANNVWEVGRGIYTASGTTLSRGALWSSSGAATAASLTATALVSIAVLAEDLQLAFFEPLQSAQTITSAALAVGTMQVGSFQLPTMLVLNQVRHLASRAVVNPIVSVTSSAASHTTTMSCSFGSTQSIVLYSQQGGTSTLSYTSFASTSASFALSATLSASISSSSRTVSETLQFNFPQGTGTSSSSMSSSSSSSGPAGTTSFQFANASTSNFATLLRQDMPWATTLPAGPYLIGLMGNTASATQAANATMSVAAPSWLGSTLVLTNWTSVVIVPGATTNFFPGVGSTSSVGSVIPGSIAWQGLSSIASNPVPYFHAGLL